MMLNELLCVVWVSFVVSGVRSVLIIICFWGVLLVFLMLLSCIILLGFFGGFLLSFNMCFVRFGFGVKIIVLSIVMFEWILCCYFMSKC